MNDKNPQPEHDLPAWPDDPRLSSEHQGVLAVVAMLPQAASLAWLMTASSDAPADTERWVRELVAFGYLTLDGDRITRIADERERGEGGA